MRLRTLGTLLGLCGGAPIPASSRRPHVLFVVADDLGWDDVGFRSHQISTPHIDRLASEGVVLDQYYVQSVCSPSRATFLTGRYPLHHTVNDWLRPGQATGLPLNETLLPELLASAGYRRHAVGKWHLGFTRWEHTPTFRGFESFVGFYGGGEKYFEHDAGGYDFRRDMRPRCGANCSRLAKQDRGHYSTHVFTARAIEVVQQHDPSEPLFLYLAYQAVHAPLEVPQQYVDAYAGRIEDPRRRGFAGMLSCLDEGLGNVTTALRARGMLEDTLVIFTTDNGGPSSGKVGGDYIGSSNYPLRGGKHSIWEGGTRGTAVVWAGTGTGLLPRARQGSVERALLHGSDWLPTLCAVAGAPGLCDRLPLDGVDQTGALFRGEPGRRGEVLYGRHDDAPERYGSYDTAVRDGDGWKLVQSWGGQPDEWSQQVNCTAEAPSEASELQAPATSPGATPRGSSALGGPPAAMLFNVLDDPGERSDMASERPDVARRLSRRLAALRAEQVDVVGGGGHPDPACPPYRMADHVDADVGHFWEPWCAAGVAAGGRGPGLTEPLAAAGGRVPEHPGERQLWV